MNIKKFSEVTGLCAHTLRYYEKRELLVNVRRNSRGHRDYSEKDVEWVHFIKRLKATGMPLKEIQAFSMLRNQGEETIEKRLEILEEHRDKLKSQINDLLRHENKILEKIEIYKNL